MARLPTKPTSLAVVFRTSPRTTKESHLAADHQQAQCGLVSVNPKEQRVTLTSPVRVDRMFAPGWDQTFNPSRPLLVEKPYLYQTPPIAHPSERAHVA